MEKQKLTSTFTNFFYSLTTKGAIILIFLLGSVVYINSLSNGFLMDDYNQILGNSLLASFKNIPLIFVNSTFDIGGYISGLHYRPIMMLIFLVLNNLVGHNAFFYHLMLVFLHITNAILIFIFLKYYFSKQMSLFLSLIFLVHPINSEIVNYASNLQDILFVFFGMLSLIFLSRKNISFKYIFLSVLFIGLSLFSKETGILFIFIAILYQILFKKGNWKLFLTFSLFITSIYFFLRSMAVGQVINGGFPMAKENMLIRIINIPQIILYYLKIFIFPSILATGYVWIIKEISFRSLYFPLFIILLLFSALFSFAYCLYKSKNRHLKPYLFFISWFIVGLIPHLQLYPLNETVSDRWFYFSLIGILGMIGVFLQEINKNKNKKTLNIFIAILLIVLLAGRTICRNSDWRNGLKLAQKDIQTNPDSYILTLTYGFELSKSGRLVEAQKQYERTIELYPEWGMAWNNLGSVYLKEGEESNNAEFIEKSRYSFTKAMEYMPANIDTPYENMAILMNKYDKPNKVEEYLNQVLKKFPSNYKMWIILATTEIKLGDNTLAQVAAERAVRLNPSCAECIRILQSLHK